jgi:hypothetical protein
MTQREIVGPQERFERSGAQRLRDIRPITTRLWSAMMSEFSGVVLAGGAMAMFVEPALVNLVAPASLLYAGLVLSRRVTLPLRLPQTAGIRDWNYPSPVGRRPRMAAGSIYLGSDLKGRELWISPEDGRQHATVPGTTGAGKTTALTLVPGERADPRLRVRAGRRQGGQQALRRGSHLTVLRSSIPLAQRRRASLCPLRWPSAEQAPTTKEACAGSGRPSW